MSTTAPGEVPPYAQVVAAIRARIEAGDLRPGDRVPSARQIIREWGVAMATATKALAALRQEGLVEAVRGVGTVVRAPGSDGVPGGARGGPGSGSSTEGAGRRPGSPTALTKEAVVAAAIGVADTEGIDGLSMRRVSTDLGVSTMALSRLVTNKEALVTAMIDHIYTEQPLPEPPPADWRQAIELAVLTEWHIYCRHPWAIRLTPVAGAVQAIALFENVEWMMRVLTAQGLSPDEAMAIITFAAAYTSGMALQGTRAVVEDYEVGLDVEHWWKAREEEFLRIAQQGQYPLTFSISGPPDVYALFRLGLKHLLDGLTSLVESKHD